MNREELYELHAASTAQKIYVVLIKFKNGLHTIAKDVGEEKPWSSRNKQLAEDHAREFQKLDPQIDKAGAVTLEEAFTILQQNFSQGFQKAIQKLNDKEKKFEL